MTTTWLRAGSETLRSLMTGMAATKWSWQAADVEELCGRMGWTLLELVEGSGAVADAGLGVPGHQVRIPFRDGHVDDIRIRITQTVRDDGIERDRFMRDVFADAVAEGTAVLGEPADRRHSEPPEVRWRLDDSTVLVKYLEIAVTVRWAGNAFQDEWDQVTEALA